MFLWFIQKREEGIPIHTVDCDKSTCCSMLVAFQVMFCKTWYLLSSMAKRVSQVLERQGDYIEKYSNNSTILRCITYCLGNDNTFVTPCTVNF